MSNTSSIIYNVRNRENGLFASSNFQNHLFSSRLSISKNLFKRDLVSHYGCVNAIEFSHDGNYLISGGDDRRVLMWNVQKSLLNKDVPKIMLKQHLSNIFCLSFDSTNSRIFSGGNDDCTIVHDVTTGDCIDVFYHTKPVYGLCVDPSNDNIFATAGEDGRVLIFDLRSSNDDPKTVVKYRAPFHAVQYHPIDSNFMITANAKEGAALWDNRSQRMPIIRYGGDDAAQSCMSVRFNTTGSLILALRRRLPPILYSTIDEVPISQFYNQDYYNSCTMKSCTFAGAFDEYVLSGSDDFNLYVWKIYDADLESRHQWVDKNQMVLYGHRSIVNQVRYNPQRCLIASSGVEKIIKLWNPFELENWSGSLLESINDNTRELYTHEEYISLNMTHDYSNQNTNEDPRMIAFFDYLVQQEIEGWSNSESSDQSSDHSSENSSRADSPTSDTEPTTNFTTVKTVHRSRDSLRRNEASQRHKYRNRIQYLIATKRKSLKRLALKRCARNINARRMKNKYVPRQAAKRNSLRNVARKPYDKKMRRLSVQTKYKKPVSHEQTSDSEVPQKNKKRRHASYNANSSYRSFRRKAKTPLSSASNTSTRAADKSDSSSDYDDDTLDDSKNEYNHNSKNLPSTSTSATTMPILDINVPSTSTGITSNNRLFFRIATYDSDDDQSISDSNNQTENNHLLHRSPPSYNNNNNNNNHINNFNKRHYNNHFDSEVNNGASTSQRNNFFNTLHRPLHHHHHHENGRRKYRTSQEEEHDFEDYASTNNSNSLLSSTESSNDSNQEYFSKKRKLNNGSSVNCDDTRNKEKTNFSYNLASSSTSATVMNNHFETPVRRKIKNNEPDSGIDSITPSTSSSSKGNGAISSASTAGPSNMHIVKKIDAVKRNYRKNMQTSDDSD
ncbi:hypothetical protein PVAND_002817 [Polypedilum vanderplanki]|uniref:Uncharacterized protein n=1 Tax=Polypedilum vanderplanki TaxID=319348 RepID=A0A9J6BTA2_POLVA|nr:hypothetical protein PVAND_002817 [Polypedilum vanderplanki]